ncbi:Nucleoside-diphosphate-sugar epimerase [Pseudomonas sp. 43mfcvi1.1]|jgi:nucleoside-diphosphate-sugar epimerase|uniref:NAD-dependent epimerase/dehydratase family protein n=1 Tax=unclassified Pseudomonas TaxID=196821 RepID=UPI000D6CDACA|nr:MULTISPECIES: NAD(P)-dependent oxidoreductase [unclassified Pseudomonas]AXP02032.1 NAD(P)-dependent oxidoreductase [Pseudomonas fluorescens]PWJ41140.1 ADP-glyceromanno-heptose 6-epimerase precursor [Pseudomonas sp. 43mfcvi1.1]BBH32008.1 putative epimerase [Pseudomonas sp. St290]SSB94293.1 Nucleoside-diphosphate-sugar epimerase [Pseudomonas sp. 43mfcvi1.1]
MKSLVIGSTSVVGKAVAQALSRCGPVKLAGRREADITFDLSSPVPCACDEHFDVVVLAAADFGGRQPDDLVRAELVNSVGALAACRLAEQCGARHFILLSSRSACDQTTDPYFGIYSLSKRHAEEVASLYCQERGMALTVLRISQVYDDGGQCRLHQPLLYAIADKAQVGRTVELYGSNDARRNYVHLSDLAEVCARLAERGVAGLYNCGHPESLRLSEIAQAAFEAFGKPVDVRFLPEKSDIPDLPPFDCAHQLYEQIGFTPRIDVRRGFELMRAHRENLS